MTLRITLFAIALATTALAHSKCAMFMGQEATSPNGSFRIVVAALKGGTYDFEYFKKVGKCWKSVTKSSVPAHGHHAQFYVADDGSGFALYDRYEGIELYSPNGKARATWTADQILKTVGDKRVGHWTCHGNGGWSTDWSPSFSGTTLIAKAGKRTNVLVDVSRATLREMTVDDGTLLYLAALGGSMAHAAASRRKR